MDYIMKMNFLDIGFQSLNLFSGILGVFFGGFMMRYRAMAVVVVYFMGLSLYFGLRGSLNVEQFF